jgi:hypothetical protein
VICRQFNERYTSHLLPNTGHNIRFTLCQLWSRSNPIKLHFLILSHQYSNERTSPAISGSSTIQCVLYSIFAAKRSLNPPNYATLTLILFKPNIITFVLVQASIFNWTYLRCDWWFIDKSMRVILHICCQKKRVSSSLCYFNHGPGPIKYSYISCYSGCNIQLSVSPSILVICRQSNARYTPHSHPNTGHNIRFTLS